MTDLPPYRDEADDEESNRPAAGGEWKKWSAIAIVLLLLGAMIVLHLTGLVGPAR